MNSLLQLDDHRSRSTNALCEPPRSSLSARPFLRDGSKRLTAGLRRPLYLALLLAVSFTGIRSIAGLSAAEAPSDHHVERFFKKHCHKCHSDKLQEGELRLDTLPHDFVEPMNVTHWEDIRNRLNSGAMPPADEPQPDPVELLAVIDWIATKFTQAEGARHARRDPVSLHRLTREEYAHTIYDLLGVHVDVADPNGLLPDDTWHGVERIGSVLSLSPAHVEKYYAVADRILAEAFPSQRPTTLQRHRDAFTLRGTDAERTESTRRGVADRVRVELWPGAQILGRGGPGQSLPAAGVYRVRVQLSGLKPTRGLAPHLRFYAIELDRVLFEQDVVTAEDQPVILEFETHLPAGSHDILVSNAVPGPSVSPATSRTSLPFLTVKEGRDPWQIKLTDEEGKPLYPFLILDWIEWEGPLAPRVPTDLAIDSPVDANELSQLQRYLTRFASLAYRRPARSVEIDPLVQLVHTGLARGEPFADALNSARMAILCSSDFCYLVEGEARSDSLQINDWELASRLSYFLWSSMPDGVLFEAAEQGILHRPEVLRSQVARMLADPKSQRFVESFPRQWLQLQLLGMFPPDRKLYPDYDAYLEKSMIGETTSFFGEVLRENLSLQEFLDSDWTMLNLRLATHYDIADFELTPGANPDRFVRVPLGPNDRRGGVLTQASVLTLTSDGVRHRPVHRGKWVLESIFGKSPPPPPASVDAIEPTPSDRPKATLREKLRAHTQNASCAACHRQIDPLGLAFENYDAIGRWRTHEIVGDGLGDNPPVDPSGELPDGRTFADATEFKHLLRDDLEQFTATLTEKLAVYALRRPMTYDDRATLEEIARQGAEADYRLPALIEALVLSDLFQKR
ncbi:DUF1592 domain-containing protein [Planctomicrobium sp. SH664]|uniref:DUF1592 domain-containing protein n=1 Tax=Planctomicrobium sp. SH664 TaxID=3448125 RepID=UPI003F5C9A34